MLNKSFKALIISLLIAFSSSLYAQKITVTGTVTESASGLPIPGATVYEVGTTNGTITTGEGKYSISVAGPTSKLEFSFVGFANRVVEVSSQTTIDIALEEETSELDEVVVIGYGTQKKKVVTGAISSVGAEEIASTPILRIEQAMQGRTAGVQVTNMSGQPGEAPTVRVRGAGTTGNAEPLYIVDGMAVGGIDYLNPGDIESMDVLKDAASAAIYGARAANGVILITTKSGQKGKMNVTYSGYQGIQNTSKKLDMLDSEQYMMIMNEGARNAKLTEPFDLNEIPKYNTNWQDALFQKNVPITNHELSVSGGNDKSTYSSSVSYFSQQGIIGGEKSQFDRITARLNTRHKVTDKFNFGNNLSYSHIYRRGVASNQSFNGPYSSALNMDPLTPLYVDDEEVLNTYPYSDEPVVRDANGNVYGISDYVGAEVVNPLALIETSTGKTRVDKVIGNIFGEYEAIEGLKFKTSLGIDLAYVLNDGYKPLFFLNGAQLNVDKTSVNKEINRYFTWQWENTASYSKQIEDHNFSALLGMTASKYNFENLAGFNAKVPITDPNHVYLNMANDTAWTAYGGAAHSSLLSNFARVTYDFKSKYSFTGIIRRDGSSKFGANKRFGIFPSLGVSWLLSDEEFIPVPASVTFLKFRASWGKNGNQEIGDYQFISIMDRSRSYIFGGGREIGSSPQYIENADIHWEESEQIDIALDLGAFDNRLTATLDFYRKTTEGLLERIPILAHVGNDPPFANVGSVRNQGVELALNWRTAKEDFSYSIGINGAYNQNKMTHIGNSEKVLPGASWAIQGMVTRAEEGYPIAYFWGYETAGIFQNQAEVYQHIGITGKPLQPRAVPGDVRFVDTNNDGVLNADDRTMIGNPTPDLTLGLNFSFEYKNFDFSTLIIGAYGNDVLNGSQRPDLRYTNRTTAILDRWHGEGTSTTVPRYSWIDTNNNYRVSDLYIEDGSYTKVKNLQIGYTLPKPFLRSIGADVWRFYLSFENLYTLTKYTGADPEIGAMSSFDIGIDRGIYPHARTVRFGTSITF